MIVVPDSDIILIKSPLKLDNYNQITFSNASEQESYFKSLPHLEYDGCTYQRKDGVIRYNTNKEDNPYAPRFEDLLHYNYCMYKNDSYQDKWFYAFITDVKYINDGMSEVTIETDTFQTWQFNLNYKNSFIEREHVNDDTVGLHTVPENLETGEYICNSHYKDATMDNYASDLCFVMASTSQPITGDAKDTVAPSQIYNGIYTGLTYYQYEATSAIDIILEVFAKAGKTDAINGIFMAPKWLAPLRDGTLYREVNPSNAPLSFNINVTKQTTLNGYTPINNKLKCFPYNYLLVSNNVGQNGILHYEKFSNNDATFTVKGVINPGCSINITPTNYNGNASSDIDAIQLGKFPICNFQNDMYTNWLTQNSINVAGQTITSDDMNIASTGLSALSGTITNVAAGNYAGGGMSLASGFTGIAGAVMQQKQHNMISPTVNGQLNSADVNVASGNNTFHFYKMSIKSEYAKMIDDFFTMYGYKVNRLAIPNIHKRANWDYIKCIDVNIEGDVPEADLEKIRSLFNNGCTFWHNTSTFLNYSASNSIL